jgi:hypothetical protein
MVKRVLFIAGLLLSQLSTYAQRIETDKKLVFTEGSKDSVYTVSVNIKNFRVVDKYKVTVEDKNTGTASGGIDYVLATDKALDLTSSAPGGQFSFTVKNDAVVEPDETIILRIQATRADTVLYAFRTLTIVDPKFVKPKQPRIRPVADTTFASLKILTAASFDFYGKPQFKDFAGDLTVHMPELWETDKFTIGLNTGIRRFHYYTADSTNRRIITDNILLRPVGQPPVVDTTRYVRRISALNSKTDIKTWGYTVQLLFGRAGQDRKRFVRGYATVHLEGLSNTYRTVYTKSALRNDTLTYRKADQGQVFAYYEPIRPTAVELKKAQAWFGGGYTMYAAFPKKFDFFGQAIFGGNTNNPIFSTEIRNVNGSPVATRVTRFQGRPFYLYKARITEKYTKLNGTAGVEIRGNFNDPSSSFVAAYLGVLINIDTFFK